MQQLLKGSKRWLLLAGTIPALMGCDKPAPPEPLNKPTLGLMTSLPILWSGNDAFASLSADENEPHWAKAALEARYRLDPIDAISAEVLEPVDILVLAQPRALTPDENVALDDWVRMGGTALVFADPQLVGDYDYPLGDPRRPMDTSLLSPILARWGLELLHGDEAVQTLALGEAEMAIAAAGTLRPVPGDDAQCRVTLQDVLASCSIGAGRVVVLADATLVEDPVGGSGSPDALYALLGMVRETSRSKQGNIGE